MTAKETAAHINTLATFCGPRDLPALTPQAIAAVTGNPQADLLVLFGGSILCGGDVLAQAMRCGAAKHYMVVGGAGHTTESLRRAVREACPNILTTGLTEAELFSRYIAQKYGLPLDLLEKQSTNCGNNVTFCLDLLRQKGIAPQSIILMQDATMQRRMEAGFRKYLHTTLLNFAAYQVEVCAEGTEFVYKTPPAGMWPIQHYLTLLLGELPRLANNAQGYGPKGKGYIAPVKIPDAVQTAFEALRTQYPALVRSANPAFAGNGPAVTQTMSSTV
jgi:uncharacterized SAM-binding protein YcdF (DUF218 family)